MTNCLFDALFEPHRSTARPFLLAPDGTETSYSAFLEFAAQLANALVKLGVRPGDRVAAQVEKSPAALALYAACIQAGAIYLPLNSAYTADETNYFLCDAEPALLVCDPRYRERFFQTVDTRARVIASLSSAGQGTLAELTRSQAKNFQTIARMPDDSAAILYTSGTTGRSKGAVLSHYNLLSNARTLRDIWHFTERDVLVHALPIFHVHGLFVATNVILAAGGSMIFLPSFDASTAISNFSRATAMMGVPTFYTRMLDCPELSPETVSRVRVFISGSAPLLSSTFEAFQARTGQRILERYGMTETGMITSNPYDRERRPGSVGLALPEVSVRIADPDTGAELPRGVAGGIEVKGPNVFSGYWKRPELRESEFCKDGFFRTGDLGYMDGHGYVFIVGRAKDLIISGGLNVYPKEIEALIDGFEGVVESAVFGVPHKDFGEAVVAAVVAKDPALSEQSIKVRVAEKLAAFKAPKKVLMLDELPRNTMGKVQKNVLRQRYEALFE